MHLRVDVLTPGPAKPDRIISITTAPVHRPCPSQAAGPLNIPRFHN
jgi:hypothetical protein